MLAFSALISPFYLCGTVIRIKNYTEEIDSIEIDLADE